MSGILKTALLVASTGCVAFSCVGDDAPVEHAREAATAQDAGSARPWAGTVAAGAQSGGGSELFSKNNDDPPFATLTYRR